MQERYDLFVHDGEVWRSGDEEEVYTGPWPVRIFVLRRDFLDGRGAGIARLEKFGEIIEEYPLKDQHHEYTTYAVLLEVASAKDFLALDKLIEWDCWTEERPEGEE